MKDYAVISHLNHTFFCWRNL